MPPFWIEKDISHSLTLVAVMLTNEFSI